MTATTEKSITQLLVAWSEGDRAALDELVPLVHSELRRIARNYMRGERKGHTLRLFVKRERILWRETTDFMSVVLQFRPNRTSLC